MKRLLTVLTVGLILTAQVFAHDLYLKTNSYFVAPKSTIKFETINGDFNESVAPFTVARFSDASLLFSMDKIARLKVEDLIKGEKVSFINLPTDADGTYIFGLSTTARELVFTAKAIFQVGDKLTDDYKRIVGYAVEIVPQKNPYNLKSGKTLEVICLQNGKPVANQTVFAGRIGTDRKLTLEPNVRTNNKGIAKIKLNGAGKWFVRFAGFGGLQEKAMTTNRLGRL